MKYILDNPLSSKCTIYTAGEADKFGVATYTSEIVECAIFEGKQTNINLEGKTIVSNTVIGLKINPPVLGMVFMGESIDPAPPSGSYEILKTATARNENQEIEGYWIWL